MLKRAWYLLAGGWALLLILFTGADLPHMHEGDRNFWWAVTVG